MLPKSLPEALIAIEAEPCSASVRRSFVDYYLRIKRTELGRFDVYMKSNGIDCPARHDASGSRTSISIFSDEIPSGETGYKMDPNPRNNASPLRQRQRLLMTGTSLCRKTACTA